MGASFGFLPATRNDIRLLTDATRNDIRLLTDEIRATRDDTDATRNDTDATRNDIRLLTDEIRATRDEVRLCATRDEFRVHAFNMESHMYAIDSNVRFLCDRTICPTGKKRATHATVLIMINGDEKGLGHGLLMCHADKCFILTAAHVAVDFVGVKCVALKWHPRGDSADLLLPAFVEDVYLPESYIKDGSHDIGLIKIDLNPSNWSNWSALMIDKDPSASGVVVGEGANKFHLRGERVQSILHNGSRHIVHAPSKPGMSGLPLFEANGNLVCLIHGDTKHRGGHKPDEMDRPSPFLYAIIPNKLTMRCVNNDWAEALCSAEALLPKFAHETDQLPDSESTSDDYNAYAYTLGNALKMEEDDIKKTSVVEMMNTLADKCFTGKEEDVIIGDKIMVATNVTAEELVDKLSQGHRSAMPKPQTPSPVQRQRDQ